MNDVTAVLPDRLGRAIRLQCGGLYAIWFREVKRAMRDRGQLIGGVSRPLLWVLIMGIGLNPYFRGEVYGEVRFVVPYTYLQFIFPAVIALNIMYTSVQSAVSVIWDRQFGFLREILVSPLPRATILLGKVLGGATVALFHGCLVLVLARFADLSLSPGDIVWGLASDGAARVRSDIARRRHRRPHPQLRGVWRVLQRRDPAVVFHLEFGLSAGPFADRRTDPRDLSGMAGDPGAMQSHDLCGRCIAWSLHTLQSVRPMDGAGDTGRHGGAVLRAGAARLQ